MKLDFPEILETGIMPVKYKSLPTDERNRALCADGLVGWAHCMIGQEPPKKFGEGMVIIGQTLNISASSDSLSDYADTFK